MATPRDEVRDIGLPNQGLYEGADRCYTANQKADGEGIRCEAKRRTSNSQQYDPMHLKSSHLIMKQPDAEFDINETVRAKNEETGKWEDREVHDSSWNKTRSSWEYTLRLPKATSALPGTVLEINLRRPDI